MKERFKMAYRFRGVLMLPPVIFTVLFHYGESESAFVWPLGLFLFGLGLLGRIHAQMHLHYRLRIHKKLTVTGPYRYVRNPIYIANTLILVSLVVISELIWFVPVMLIWCGVIYSMVVRREEDHLTDKYGQAYEEYCRKTPRWIPRPAGEKRSSAGALDFLWRSIAVELHCFLWLIPFFGKEILF